MGVRDSVRPHLKSQAAVYKCRCLTFVRCALQVKPSEDTPKKDTSLFKYVRSVCVYAHLTNIQNNLGFNYIQGIQVPSQKVIGDTEKCRLGGSSRTF